MLDILVVGSGYAGSVIAARLASRCQLLVVERGRRWRSGQFPSGVLGLTRSYRSARNPGGLWAMRLGAGTGTAFANALGGSSVVNYGITSRPEDHVFADWPVTAGELAPYFDRAREVLRPAINPIGDDLGDKRFLDLVEPGRRVDLENTIDWRLCTQCGRCVPGCNEGAKRTLADTYLRIAEDAGAEIRVETEVRDIVVREPSQGGGYAVELCSAGDTEWVTTRRVVLAAGTLGTLDLVNRVRDRIPVGPMLGEGMSMNGDALAFLYDTRYPLSSESGAPISTSVRIPFTADDGAVKTLMVMSGRVPMAAMRFTAAALALVAGIIGEPHGRSAGGWRRRLRDLVTVGPGGALSRSFMYKLDGQDASRGRARFAASGTAIDWPDYADDPILLFAERRLRQWADAVGGTVVANISRLPGMRSFSVHPLGGCRMGTSVSDGVVDDVGRWLDPRGGVHDGLRIVDGSILPGSLGVPPSWTIAALAERIADDLVRELADA